MNSNKLLLGLAVALAAVSLAACGEHSLTSAEIAQAELGARDFAARGGYNFLGCSALDSDGDRYTTCNLTDKNDKRVDIVCAYSDRGCKMK